MKTISSVRKLIFVLFGSVLAYLLQACVMGYFTVSGVTGNIMFAFLAIVIVSCGKKSAFCASAIIGMLMESMLSSVSALYIICYPVFTMAWAQVFADMTDRQRERREQLHPKWRQEDHPAIVRVPLCAACMEMVMGIVQLGYVYLSGIELTAGHFGRLLLTVLFTAALAAVLFFPLRAALGMYKRPKALFRGGEIY